jgi:Protein of unknown function (DUF1592)/Protein of unknown function (DUF1588)/Protein of unknown function (DUF1595)/Protein of unknown function (DUF1585)/Protein of unknown function (DUF1587)
MKRPSRISPLSLAVLALSATLLGACGRSEPKVPGGEPGLRLLSESQYRRVIADLFGEHVSIGGTFDPLVRTNGLLTVGAADAHITPAGLEQFDRMARAIAAQVLGPEQRSIYVPCAPRADNAADDDCASRFFAAVGRMLYRRPLTADELSRPVALAAQTTAQLRDFRAGLEAGLASMLVSPSFLFIEDRTEADPDNPGKLRLDGYSRASRLSFFLWGSAPDDALLSAAEQGELQSSAGVRRQVERMLESPKLVAGLRAFFHDMLAFEDMERLEKDSIIYPVFSTAVVQDAREQTLRTLTHLLLEDELDYRDIFTTRKTFMSGPLGRIYRVPVDRPDGGWMPYEFPEGDPRAGLITHVSFAALYAHPGRSSPTLRGRAMRELLLCQKVPDPPGDVDFSLFNDPNAPSRTARQRLTVHSTQPSCAGCHKLTDPIGLALEKIDGAGQLRTTEDGIAIDTSGDLDGVKFTDAAGLGAAMRDNPAAPACVVNRLYAYAVARSPAREDKPLLVHFEEDFARGDYRIPALLREIATSDAMFAVSPPKIRTAGEENLR